MPTRLHQRVVSTVLALLVNVALLVGIDRLAGLPDASPQWAAAVLSPRG
jgi:uncharacterized protein HemY